MIFEPRTGALYADDGEFLKTVYCPMALQVKDLTKLPLKSPDRHCHDCKKTIRCVDEMTDADIRAELMREDDVCVFATAQAKHIVILKPIGLEIENDSDARAIRTVRSYEAMQDAVARGFRLQFKPVEIDDEIGVSISLYRHRATGAVHLRSLQFRPLPFAEDFGRGGSMDDWEFIGSAKCRPDAAFPFAAYLIPPDLKRGERVFVEDLIEDVGERTAGTRTDRLLSSFAKWDGQELCLERSYFEVGIIG